MPWVPQHIAAALCAILVVLLIPRLAGITSIITLALVVAATIGSSAYIGGFVVPLSATLIGLWILVKRADRQIFLIKALAAGALSLALAYPSLMDQIQAVAHRTGPSIALKNFNPLGPYVPEDIRQVLNPLAYWLLMFTIEWPALYLPGFVAVAYGLRKGRLTDERALDAGMLICLAIAGLTITFLIRSIIGNNDLGWRAVMPAFLVLTAMTSAGLASWFRGTGMAIATLVLIGLSLPNGIEYVRRLVEAYPSTSAAKFVGAPDLWAAVRRHTGPNERVINNPLYLYNMTPCPTNISWALLSNRRSCFAVWEMVVVYSPLSNKDSYDTAQVYNRSFAGIPASDDMQKMAKRYGCDVAVVTPFDGAWNNDPFAKTEYYALAESTANWRIYRRTQ